MRPFITLFAATFAVAALVTLAPPVARAADYTLTIKDHKFSPAELKVPANKRIVITVINNDITPEEFESGVLRVEKVIAGNSKGTVRIGPLEARPLSFRRRIS